MDGGGGGSRNDSFVNPPGTCRTGKMSVVVVAVAVVLLPVVQVVVGSNHDCCDCNNKAVVLPQWTMNQQCDDTYLSLSLVIVYILYLYPVRGE